MASLRDEIGDFVGIPISFMEDTKQTAESRVVFMVLRYHTNKKSKRAFPGYETIMTESGLSRQKTAEGIKVLVNTGWLVKHKQFAKVTEYELRYPARALSSAGELQQGVTLVPPADAVSSAGEQPPYCPEQDQSNKIEIHTRASGNSKPRKPGSFDERNDKSPKFGIELIRVLPEDWLETQRLTLSVEFPALVFDDIHSEWCDARDRDGSIGKFNCRLPTLVQYAADIKIFFRNWNRNHQGRNGNNGNGKLSRAEIGLTGVNELLEEARNGR